MFSYLVLEAGWLPPAILLPHVSLLVVDHVHHLVAQVVPHPLYRLECEAENCSLTLVVFAVRPKYVLRGCENSGQQYQFDHTLISTL